jgi:hypothetical protein
MSVIGAGKNLEDFIKIHIINGDTKKSPLVVHLNQTGYGVDDLSSLTCIPKLKIDRIIRTGGLPNHHDLLCYDMAFQLPSGTFSKEYGLWLESLPA